MRYDLYRKKITDIEKITVEDSKTYDECMFAQKVISIHTKYGETHEFILQADKPENLEFREATDPNAWLTPKVYKGSMSAE